MKELAERVAWEVRQKLDLGMAGPPTVEQLEFWAETVPGLSVVIDADTAAPYYTALPGGRGRIVLPPRYTLEDLAHEASHHLAGHGLAAYLRMVAQGDPRLERLAAQCGWQEEAVAKAFVLALFLPPRTVLTHTDYQLAEMVPVSLDTIRTRRWDLIRRIQWQGWDSIPGLAL